MGEYYRVAPKAVKITIAPGDELIVLVEAMGRINYGPALPTDPKGLSGVRARLHALAWP